MNYTGGLIFAIVGSILMFFKVSEARYIEDALEFEDVAKLKIVSGSNVVRGNWPWQTLILIKKRNQAKLTICGGTLIEREWVLTAAHCVVGSLKMQVYLGVWNVTNRIEVGRVAGREKGVFIHPCYDGSESAALSGYNVALVNLNNKIFNFDSACLIRKKSHDWKKLTDGKSLDGCVTTGYGVTDNGRFAEILQKAEFSTVSMVACEAYGKLPANDNILCATDDRVTGKDTCMGDMGGPLVCPTTRSYCNGYYLAGVTLPRFSNCGEEGKPGAYAAVQPNLSWIESVMNEGQTETKDQAYHCMNNPTTMRAILGRDTQSPAMSASGAETSPKIVGFLKMRQSSSLRAGDRLNSIQS